MFSLVSIKGLYKDLRGILRFIASHIELFLISGLIVIAAIQYHVRPQSQSYDQIVESGSLRVLIADEPDSQYVFNKQHYGFEYELLATFARSLSVELELVVVPYGELFTLLSAGAGDIAVGGILDTEFVHKVSQPSIPWFKAKTTVVYKRGTKRPKDLAEINAATVLSSSRYYGLQNFDSVSLTDDHRSEYEILNSVAVGQDRFAISTDYRARNAKHYLPEISRSFILPDKVDLVWSLPKKGDEKLLAVLNQFLQTAIDKKLPEQLESYYLGLPTSLSRFDALVLNKNIYQRLPQFESLFRSAARSVGIDWTLLAAMSYQESRWVNEAESPTGVKGIMQITASTAEYIDLEDRLDVDQSIVAAAKYFSYLKSRLPESIEEPQRTWFAVGAYNVGLKHVQAAYKEAQKRGLESNQWNTISQILLTLYGKRFANGEQAKTYVERVQIFTDILRFYDSHLRDKIDQKQGNDLQLTKAT